MVGRSKCMIFDTKADERSKELLMCTCPSITGPFSLPLYTYQSLVNIFAHAMLFISLCFS